MKADLRVKHTLEEILLFFFPFLCFKVNLNSFKTVQYSQAEIRASTKGQIVAQDFRV